MINIREKCNERTGDEVFENTRLLPSEHIYLWNSFVREKKKYSISKVDEYPETKLARSTSNSSSGIESDSGSSGFDEMDSRLTIAERIKKMGGDPVVARVPKTARNKLERHSSGFSELQKSPIVSKSPPLPPPQSAKPKLQQEPDPDVVFKKPKAPPKPKRIKSNRNSTVLQAVPAKAQENQRVSEPDENIYDIVYNDDKCSLANSSPNGSIRPSFPPPPPYQSIVKIENSTSFAQHSSQLIHTSIDIPAKCRPKSLCLPPQTKLWWRNFKMIAILVVTLICVIVILVLTFTTNKV
ncbi:unnamed protein product [Oikopleura dioica]|uniref:Uncharacterized protein n=1 Tax=Oikopleura dioica TaxID=34765 RepID=E4YPG1_OIKDI|nr:unnamed protein product [Oikopleura dioica]